MQSIIVNGTYRHFKGNEYKVLHVARHSETLEYMIVYQAQYGDRSIWVRPANMFVEEITRDGKTFERFSYVNPNIDTQLTVELSDEIKKTLYENNIDLLQELKREYPQLTSKVEFTDDGAKDIGTIILCSGVAASLVLIAITKLLETVLYRPHYVSVEEIGEEGTVIKRYTEVLQPHTPKSSLVIGAEIDASKAKITIEDRKE